MNVKIEQIEQAESKISSLGQEERNMRKIYMQDGVIDDTEQKTLDRIKDKIGKLTDVVSKLRAEVEENKRIWESKAGELSEIQTQLSEIAAFGYPDGKIVAKEVKSIEGLTRDQRWADATATLDQAIHNFAHVWEGYLLQKAAKEEYDPLFADYTTRLEAAKVAEPQNELVIGLLTQIETNEPAFLASVDARNYTEALPILKTSLGELEKAENEIVRLETLKADFERDFGNLHNKIIDSSVSEFKALSEAQQKSASLQTAIEQAVEAGNYETATERLNEFAPHLDELIAEQTRLRELQQSYLDKKALLDPRLQASSTSELASAAETQQAIIDAETAAQTSFDNQEFDAAISSLGELDRALTAYEATIDARDLYELRLEAMKDELLEASISEARWEYLSPIQADMASLQTEMENAASTEDFEGAMKPLVKLEAKLVEFYGAIEAKKREYDEARAALAADLARVDECTYAALSAAKGTVNSALALVDEAVLAEDWAGAIKALEGVKKEIEAFDTALKTHEDDLKVKINAKLPTIKTGLTSMSDAKSPIRKRIAGMVASIDRALAGKGDLEKALADVGDAEKQLQELRQVYEIRGKLEAASFLGDDDEARDIVDELANDTDSAGVSKLAKLPLEGKNLLVDAIMDSSLDKDDHDAIQEIWNTPALDKRFDEVDKKTRAAIIDKYKNDPEVQALAAKWAGPPPLSDEEKTKAVVKLAKIPFGDGGWDVEPLDESQIDTSKDQFKGKETTLYGSYDQDDEILNLNLDHPSHQDFTVVAQTIAHEMGHRYQQDMIDRLDPDHKNPITPGSPEYDQAVALKLNQEYRTEHTSEWRDMSYSRTPEEAHSRAVGNDMNAGLSAAYGPGEPE